MFYFNYNVWVVRSNCWYFIHFKVIFVSCKERCLFYRYMNRYIICKLYYKKMFDLIILIVVNVASEVLFNNLVESFCLSISLGMKDYRKFAIYS